MIDGECASSMVDSSTLPDYSDELVFPGGDRSKCFTTTACFTGWREAVDVDLDGCTAPKGGDVTNIALLTADTGACTPSGHCFVPIDRSDEGWRDEGDRVRLPKGVCKKLRQGAKLGFVGGTACAQKTPDLPVCTNRETAPPDAGKSDSAADGGSRVAEKVAEAGGVSGLAVLDGRSFYGSTDGLFELAGGQTRTLTFSPTGPRIAPWFLAQHGDNVVFADGTSVAALGELKATIFPNGGATKDVTFVPPNGILPRSAAIGPQRAWIAFTDESGGGNVLATDFGISSPATTALAPVSSTPATAVGYAQNDFLWIGDETGKVALCDTSPIPFSCSASVQLDPSGPAIDGIGTAPSTIDQAFSCGPTGSSSQREQGPRRFRRSDSRPTISQASTMAPTSRAGSPPMRSVRSTRRSAVSSMCRRTGRGSACSPTRLERRCSTSSLRCCPTRPSSTSTSLFAARIAAGGGVYRRGSQRRVSDGRPPFARHSPRGEVPRRRPARSRRHGRRRGGAPSAARSEGRDQVCSSRKRGSIQRSSSGSLARRARLPRSRESTSRA